MPLSGVARFLSMAAAAVFFMLLSASPAPAGPPFRTDDPDTPDYRHWQFYAGVARQNETGETFGAAPLVEADYGVLPDVQLHALAQNAFDRAANGPTLFGIGNVELGVEYRFLHEGRYLPMAAVFPLLEVPTGSRARGLGTGSAQLFLPLWFQKSTGQWTFFGGGGYWINPGAGNRDFWYTGWVLEREVTKHLALGAEVFHLTPPAEDRGNETGYNLGAIVNLTDTHHFIFSAGSDIRGPARFFFYAAYLATWGPPEKGGEAKGTK